MRRLSTQPTAYAAPSPLPAERAATVCGGPCGMLIAKANTLPTDAQPYKYGGKELDRRFGWQSVAFDPRTVAADFNFAKNADFTFPGTFKGNLVRIGSYELFYRVAAIKAMFLFSTPIGRAVLYKSFWDYYK